MMPMKVPTGTPSDTLKVSLNCWSLLSSSDDGDELESEFESSSADDTVVNWLANSAKHRRMDVMRKSNDDDDEVVALIEDQWKGEYVQKLWWRPSTFRLRL